MDQDGDIKIKDCRLIFDSLTGEGHIVRFNPVHTFDYGYDIVKSPSIFNDSDKKN